MRQFINVLCLLLLTGCGSIPVPPPPQPLTIPGALRAVRMPVHGVDGSPVVGVDCTLDDQPPRQGVSDDQGVVTWLADTGLRATQVACSKNGYGDVREHRELRSGEPEELTAVTLTATHVDPARYSVEQLLRFRGALFTVKVPGLPYGPRPNSPDNVALAASIWVYTPEQRQAIFQAWRDRGYTHYPVGPFIDPGYHGQIPGFDFRANPDAAADLVQDVWDAGLIPIVFIVPDHYGPDRGSGDHLWTLAELSELEPVYRSDRWQQLCRVVVLGWELQGSVYGWSNNTYVAYLSWLADVFPHSVRGLHTIADIEAPVGAGDETTPARCSQRQRETGQCIDGNGGAWAHVTPLIHFWLHQSSALFHPEHVADNGKTDGQNWLDLWDFNNPHSFVSRFRIGTAGWPTFSANGGALCAVAGEYLSYLVYWQNHSEDDARDWGQKALRIGACGFMDGGREP